MSHPYRFPDRAAPRVATATKLAADVLAKHAADVDASARFPSECIDAVSRAGLMGLALPTSNGGQGEGMRAFAAVTEELAAACGSTAMIYVMHVSASQAIASGQTLDGRDAILRQLASGEHLTTLAFSERGSRSQFWAPVSTLTTLPAGFRTSAEKSWVTSASRATSYVSSAQKPGAASPLESTVYLVRRDAPGVKTAGKFDGLGLRGNDSAPVTLKDVTVAEGDLLSAQRQVGRAEVIHPCLQRLRQRHAKVGLPGDVASPQLGIANRQAPVLAVQQHGLPLLAQPSRKRTCRLDRHVAVGGSGLQELDHLSRGRVDALVEERRQQVLLAGEVPVQSAFRVPGLGGDLVDAGLVVAAAREHL